MKKGLRIALLIIAALVLLVPRAVGLDDGGTVEYAALLYKVSVVHRIKPSMTGREYEEGIEVTILGVEVYSNVK